MCEGAHVSRLSGDCDVSDLVAGRDSSACCMQGSQRQLETWVQLWRDSGLRASRELISTLVQASAGAQHAAHV